METVNSLMQEAVAGNIFPGATLLVSKSGNVIFHRAYGVANIYTQEGVTLKTVFDLASLTKPLATTLAIIKLLQDNQLTLDQKIGSILPESKKSFISESQISHLLYHTSGLPDYRQYFLKIPPDSYPIKKKILREFLVRENMITPIGEKTLYSDLGFMVLDWVIETVSGVRLDQFITKNIYLPLGLGDLFFIDLEQPIPEKPYAATEICPWREKLISGMVHDENAYSMGGIAGHAGLFGTADAVNTLLTELMNAYLGFAQNIFTDQILVKRFLDQKTNTERVMGFDVPDAENSSCGDCFNKKETVGHLGFTGTSFWLDLSQQVIVVLLTNRIHPTRDNEKIKVFRPILHNTVMKQLVSEV